MKPKPMVTMANVGAVFKEGACGGPGNFSMTVDSTTIDSLKRKDTELKKEIEKIKENIGSNIGNKISQLEECCEENRKKNDEQDSRLNEINTNISFLKGWNTKQDQRIDGLNKNVIVDNTYNNFQEWFENVYMKNPSKYNWKPGDIYINNNPNNVAVNGTWISTGPITHNTTENHTHPIENWVELTVQQPSDKITILGIDPIKVDHPSKHEWVVSVDPDKLGKLISELPVLDLSKTEIKLGKVFTTPIYKDDARFELNVTVEGDTFLNNLVVNGLAQFKDVIIKDLKVETISSPNVTFEHNATIQENLTIHNHTTTEYITVNQTAKIENLDLDNEIRINTEKYPCSGQYYDVIQALNNGQGAPQSKYVAINQTIFQPSFAKFVITAKGEKYGDRTRSDNQLRIERNPESDGEYRSRLIPLGGQMNNGSILSQPFKGVIGDLVPMSYNTPDIFRFQDSAMIVIANSGIYNINYIYNISQSPNIWANRAGLALIRLGGRNNFFQTIGGLRDLQIEDLVDNKWQGSRGDQPEGNAWVHRDTTYHGSDYTYRDDDSKIKRISGHLGMSLGFWSASGSTLVEIPCGEMCVIVPYIKPSVAGGSDHEHFAHQYPTWKTLAYLSIMDGKWNTGAFSQINIQKIANATTQSTADGRTIR